jgi:hypothetical protein
MLGYSPCIRQRCENLHCPRRQSDCGGNLGHIRILLKGTSQRRFSQTGHTRHYQLHVPPKKLYEFKRLRDRN